MMFRVAVLLLLIALGITMAFAPSLHAANAIVGNGTAASCTEAAFDTALSAVQNSGGGTITFNCGGPKTIVFSNQKLLNDADTTISGGGQITLSGGNQTRLFFVNTGRALTLQGITLRDGFADVGGGLIEIFGGVVTVANSRLLNSEATTDGGAINCSIDQTGAIHVSGSEISGNEAKKGGAIYSGGCDLTLGDSEMAGNTAATAGAGTGLGGAIYLGAPGRLEAAGVTLAENEGFDGGAIYIDTGAEAIINNSLFADNVAEYGAGIELHGEAEIVESTFDDNRANVAGGAIWNATGDLEASLSAFTGNVGGIGGAIVAYGPRTFLTYVTIDSNVAGAQGGGGGIYVAGVGNMTILHSTISNNVTTTDKGDGGGIFHAGGGLQLTNSTIANNVAPLAEGGGLYVDGGGTDLIYVTLAGNQATDGSQIYFYPFSTSLAPRLFGTALSGDDKSCGGQAFTSFGYNLSAGPCISLNQTGDLVNLGTLRLEPLAFNGGPGGTETMLPATESLLVDAIPAAQCHPAVTDDQRLVARPQGAGCDAGAVERRPEDEERLIYLPAIIR